jgi:hypothetical protein
MVISWVFIIGVVFIIFLMIKFDHQIRIIKIFTIIGILLLLSFSFYNIFKQNNVDTSSPKEVANAIYVYFGWLGTTMGQLWDIGKTTVTAVGNVVKTNESDIEIQTIDFETEKENLADKISLFIKNKILNS